MERCTRRSSSTPPCVHADLRPERETPPAGRPPVRRSGLVLQRHATLGCDCTRGAETGGHDDGDRATVDQERPGCPRTRERRVGPHHGGGERRRGRTCPDRPGTGPADHFDGLAPACRHHGTARGLPGARAVRDRGPGTPGRRRRQRRSHPVRDGPAHHTAGQPAPVLSCVCTPRFDDRWYSNLESPDPPRAGGVVRPERAGQRESGGAHHPPQVSPRPRL